MSQPVRAHICDGFYQLQLIPLVSVIQ